MSVAPIAIPLGRSTLLHGIVAGAALIFPRSADLPGLWAAIHDEHPTWMAASSGVVEMLASYLRVTPVGHPPSSFRFVHVTAGAVSPEICDELATRLGTPVLPRYSSSEIGAVATALPPPAKSKPGSVGIPIQELRIVNGDGADARPGAEGEIWVRNSKGFSGYLDDPELTAATFVSGGWFRTGDVGRLDEDGFLYLTGRLNELINRGGEKIAPVEVDQALQSHPAVADAAVFAVPDALLGEDLVAAVVLKPGETIARRAVHGWLLDRLSPFKVPRRIWLVDELPRTRTGKVQRGELARRWSDERG
jgi:acyl-CoA synthetase (AMP-forming)/AMP-acid ligase II